VSAMEKGRLSRLQMFRVINEGTGEQRRTETVGNGTFTVPLLPPAVYDVMVTYTGFRTEKRSGIKLSAGGTNGRTVLSKTK